MAQQLRKKSFREMDLTTGKLFWKIPLFALPMALTTMLQLLYTTVDLWTVANFGGGSSSMAAVGSNGSMINLIVTVFVSLSLGANVAIANAKGSGRKEHAEKVMHTSLLLAAILGVVVGIFGVFISPHLLRWMGTIDSIIEKATLYLTIYFIGLPFQMIYNYSSQIMRALGDSRRPLAILAVSGLTNVLFDLLFVIFFKMDVAGVAIATVISEAVAAAISIAVLMNNRSGFIRFSFKKLGFDHTSLVEVVRIGLPAGIQGLCFCIPNVLIQSSLYTITEAEYSVEYIVNGAAASGQIEGYIFALVEAVSAACVAFTGQNYGAAKKDNVRKVFWYCQIWNVISMGLAAIVALTLGDYLLRLFLNSQDPAELVQEIGAGKQRLYLFAFTYVLDGIMDVCGSYARGMKYSTPPAVITFFGCTVSRIIFLLTIFKLPEFHTVFWLYAAFPISWVIVDLVYIPVTLIIEKKAFAKLASRMTNLPSPEQSKM